MKKLQMSTRRNIKIRLRYKGKDWEVYLADAGFVTLIAFALYSGCNDSTVAVNPVFWLLFGCFAAVLDVINNDRRKTK